MKNFYITTAIDYANGSPHLGHAYEKVLADVIARLKRLEGQHVHFLTGLDEHGQKVQQTAVRKNMSPQALCDTMAEEFKHMCQSLEISNDDYIRTTEDRHKKIVRNILQDLYDKGAIYKADYQGFYSTKEEQFLQEKDRDTNGRWPEAYGEVIEISESNYFFKLSQYRDWLVEYIESHKNFIFPAFRAKQVLEFLKDDLNDLCISRPKERLSWGIPLPFDEDYVTYVWFDALINYISAIAYETDAFKANWPVDFHVIGKDILVPAHGIYWPIMLKAIGAALPKTLIVHGWWKIDGAKMSKSLGNSINPLTLVETFGPDAFRYFLMREMNVGQDSDFSLELFNSRYNVLANDLGNLVSRLLNMAQNYCEGQVPIISVEEEPEQDLKTLWEKFISKIKEQFDHLQFHTALEEIFTFIRGINRYAEIRAPWKLAKSEAAEDRQTLETALAMMAEGLRLSSTLLMPVMPSTSLKIHQLLSMPAISEWKGQLEFSDTLRGNILGEKTILFPKIELESLAE